MRKIDKLNHIQKLNMVLLENRLTANNDPNFNEKGLKVIPELFPILNDYGLLEILKTAIVFYEKNGEANGVKASKILYDNAKNLI